MTGSFWPLLQQLQKGHFVDLTYPLGQKIPYFETTRPLVVHDTHTYATDSYFVQQFELDGQWGTHVNTPAHFFEGKRTVDQISLEEMILPLVIIDIHEKVEKNPDYILTVDDVFAWESTYGRIPSGAFVALRTDWYKKWPDQEAFYNYDLSGISRTPGWSLDVLAYLYNDCQITASGHETLTADPGAQAALTQWACQRFILKHNHYQIELLTCLDACPVKGALIICSFPKVEQATGFPARVFAICP